MALRLNPPPSWLDEAPGSLSQIKNSAWIIVGGGMVLLGSYLPFAHSNASDIGFSETISGSKLPAILLLILGICVCWSPGRWRLAVSITSLIASLLGSLVLLGVIVAWTVGYTVPTDDGYSQKVTFSIGVGLVVALAGFVVTVAGSVKSIRQRKT
jgi:hypothetical protein